jgi:hypothetical protein
VVGANRTTIWGDAGTIASEAAAARPDVASAALTASSAASTATAMMMVVAVWRRAAWTCGRDRDRRGAGDGWGINDLLLVWRGARHERVTRTIINARDERISCDVDRH